MCMVDPGGSPGWSEESVGSPLVVNWDDLNRKYVWSHGTGYGWSLSLGHPADPASTMCERWSSGTWSVLPSASLVSSSGCPLESTARQSGKKMRTTNLPFSHRVGGVVDQLPFWH